MKRKIHTLITATLLILSGVANASNEASIILTDVNDSFKLLKLLETKNFVDNDVRQMLELGFVSKLILVRSASPNLKTIKGRELSGLCNLVNYSAKTQLKAAATKDAALTKIAVNYAKSLESEVFAKVKAAQITLGGEGCNIGWSKA